MDIGTLDAEEAREAAGRRPRIETHLRTYLCFVALAIYGTLGFPFLLFEWGRDFLIWRWLPLYCRTTLWLLGIRVQVEGEEHLTSHSPCIFVSNHQGLLDIFSVPWLLRRSPMFYVVKKEFKLYPFIGQLAVGCDQVFVDRGANRGVRESLASAREKILQRKMCTVMFPEGSRRSDGGLRPFKKGAFWLAQQTGVPIVPITLVNSWRLLPQGTWDLHRGTLRIVVHAPVETAGWTRDEVGERCEEVRSIIEGALEVSD